MSSKYATADPRCRSGSMMERFNRRTQIVPIECWQWLGGLNRDGYGRIGGYDRMLAHRFAYEAMVAKIPAGMVIDHLCRNRACVNPTHMRVVTNAVNVAASPNTLTGRNLAKACCPRCGGNYSRKPQGYRRCDPCAAAWARNRRAKLKECSK